ncbi:MAG: bifunctional phosphoribosylaminoimidazolecarboxamide formyltransferase/IMP cyclohydrolase [candidate division Zixibacteria bacterium]|nr:bifunctional phosphoribosylaminoimidazolecarboxamide formyltransferase/IMP cyclohydrolase [candidate division Zixibacteria bacterium]
MSQYKTALVSVADKTGIEIFCKKLIEAGVNIIATGGTYRFLADNGIECGKIEDITGFPDLFDGRVKTLHPWIMGGILADRHKQPHLKAAEEHRISLIDIVVVNLYPFEEIVNKEGITHSDAIENIDIGGITLIRAAAKNHETVYVVTDPADYDAVIDELNSNRDTDELRRKLAEKAFNRTAHYDSLISAYFRSVNGLPDEFPELLPSGYRKSQNLRYGENPHQKAALYKNGYFNGVSLAKAILHSGREISYNNLNDLEAVLEMILDFEEPFAVIVKHTNPCGAAVAENLAQAYSDALACDEMSAFGGIVGVNRIVDMETAKRIHDTFFLECILAPGYEPEALELLTRKKNRRIISCGDLRLHDYESGWTTKPIMGGQLVQSRDRFIPDSFDFETATKSEPTEEQLKSLSFAMKIVKHIKSNAIVIVNGTKTVGVGAGQTSRVDSAMIAVRKAGERAMDAVAASDAFFPMPDGLETLAKAGVTAVIQPGGSKRDPEVIEAANNHKIAMIFTGRRHFKH